MIIYEYIATKLSPQGMNMKSIGSIKNVVKFLLKGLTFKYWLYLIVRCIQKHATEIK